MNLTTRREPMANREERRLQISGRGMERPCGRKADERTAQPGATWPDLNATRNCFQPRAEVAAFNTRRIQDDPQSIVRLALWTVPVAGAAALHIDMTRLRRTNWCAHYLSPKVSSVPRPAPTRRSNRGRGSGTDKDDHSGWLPGTVAGSTRRLDEPSHCSAECGGWQSPWPQRQSEERAISL